MLVASVNKKNIFNFIKLSSLLKKWRSVLYEIRTTFTVFIEDLRLRKIKKKKTHNFVTVIHKQCFIMQNIAVL